MKLLPYTSDPPILHPLSMQGIWPPKQATEEGQDFTVWVTSNEGFPGGKESTCQCRRCGFNPLVFCFVFLRFCSFNPWIGKISWRRKWQPTPVLLPRKFHRGACWATVHRIAKSQTWLSDFAFTFQLFCCSNYSQFTSRNLFEVALW